MPPATCSQARTKAAAGRLALSANRPGIVRSTAWMHAFPDVRLIKHIKRPGGIVYDLGRKKGKDPG